MEEIAQSDFYRGFCIADLDVDGKVRTETTRLPDCSCNAKRFSEPEDVRLRVGGRPTDGCYAMTTADIRFENFATPVHDPICEERPENYSHCELRCVPNGAAVDEEPPRNQPKAKNKTARARRLAWRTNLGKRLQIVLAAEA